MKKLKSYLSGVYNYFKTKSLEEVEEIFEKARKKELIKWKKRFAELYGDKQNQKYNVFVYETILYPPNSSAHNPLN